MSCPNCGGAGTRPDGPFEDNVFRCTWDDCRVLMFEREDSEQ